jgi:uncharacterized membrane protein YhhN
MIALTILSAITCALLVYSEYRRLARVRIAAKLVASLAFLAVGVIAHPASPYADFIVAGLALGVVGDAALLGDSKRAFLAGLTAFLLGHVAYVVACAQIEPMQYWFADAALMSALPVAVAAFALVKLWPRLGSMRVPVIAYVVVIVTMVIGALAVRYTLDRDDPMVAMLRIHRLPTESRDRLAVGAVLFFASDLAVARDKFIGKSFANKAWGLPAYYAGQLCIAWSLAT